MNIVISFTKITNEYVKNGYNNFLFKLSLDEKSQKTIFEEYLSQFSSEFKTGNFILIFKRNFVESWTIIKQIESLGIKHYTILEISEETKKSDLINTIKEKTKENESYLITYFGPVFEKKLVLYKRAAEKLILKKIGIGFNKKIRKNKNRILVNSKDKFIALISQNPKFEEFDFLNLNNFKTEGYNLETVNVKSNLNNYKRTIKSKPEFTKVVLKKLNEIEKLISNMEFEEAETSYKKNLEYNDILSEYIIYLDRTAQIDVLELALKKYSIKEKVKSHSSIKNKERLLELITKQDNISSTNKINRRLNLYSFDNSEDQKFFELIRTNITAAQNYIHENSSKYIGANVKNKDKEQLISFYIQSLIKARLVRHIDIMLFVKDMTPNAYTITSKYYPINVKHLYVKIFEYMEIYDPKYFTLRYHEGDGSVTQNNYYNHFQPLISVLATLDREKFKPGIKRYYERISQSTDIKFPRESVSPVILAEEKKNKIAEPKVAVCISGMIRKDYKYYLEGIKENVVDPLNADVYVFTWGEFETYSGLGRFPLWTQRYFLKVTQFLPEGINTAEKFKNELPETFKKLSASKYKKNDGSLIKEILPNANIIIEDESYYNKVYKNKNLERRGNMNQAKMFYGIDKSFSSALAHKKYDFIFRARFDQNPGFKYSTELLDSLEHNELGIMNNNLVGPLDLFYYGRKEEMQKMNNIWKLAEEHNDLTNFMLEGKQAQFDSHKLYMVHMLYNKIISTPQHQQKHIFNRTVAMNLPNINKELKNDLKKIPESKAKEYRAFFKKMYEVYGS